MTVTIVALPGAGSDGPYVQRLFAGQAAARGAELRAIDPDPGDLVGSYVRALDTAVADATRAAARQGTGPGAEVIVAGVSIGAVIGARWLIGHLGSDPRTPVTTGWWWLPPWSGTPAPGRSPAADAARATAAAVRSVGLDDTIAAMVASTDGWVGTELARSWRRIGPELATLLDTAAALAAPTPAELGLLVGRGITHRVVATVDDPVHPLPVAQQWAQGLDVGLSELTLEQLGGLTL